MDYKIYKISGSDKYNGNIYEFNSISQASRELNISRKKIYKLL
jgi:hypothetical protein